MKGSLVSNARILSVIVGIACALPCQPAAAKNHSTAQRVEHAASKRPFDCRKSVEPLIIGSWGLANRIGAFDEVRFDAKTREGYTFSAWNENRPDGNGRWYASGCDVYYFIDIAKPRRLFKLKQLSRQSMTVQFDHYDSVSVYQKIR
jgi:hypothetical protein